MEDIQTIKNAVTKKTSEIKDRIDRWDKDFARWDMKRAKDVGSFEYQISKKKRDTEVLVTDNKPRVFCDNVQSILSSAQRQIIIRMAEAEGVDVGAEIGKLERLLEFGFEKADERLERLVLPPLFCSLVWYSIIRGWVAGRFLAYKDGKDVIFDYIAYDPRWLTFQVGANGLLWSNYITSNSPEALEDEWGKEVHKTPWYKPWSKPDKTYDVYDYWKYEGKGKVSNGVFCGDVWLKEPEEYEMLSLPVLIAPVPTRPPVRTENGSEVEGYGESILAANRHIDDLMNEVISMWASHAKLLYKQPLLNYYNTNLGGKRLDSTILYAEGVYNLPLEGQRIEASPLKEISPTLVNLTAWAQQRQTSGSMPDIDIRTPPQSGTLQNLIQETANRVFNPHLRTLNTFYANICRLVEEQLLTGKLKVNIKTEVDKKYFETQITPVDLKRPHIIRVEFTARNPWQQLDSYQIADMAKRLGLPDKFIWEHIIRVPDVKLLEDLRALEMYEHSPQGAMKRAVEVLMDRGYAFEARNLVEQMDLMEAQEYQGGGIPARTTAQQAQPSREAETPPPPEVPPLTPAGV